mgnify:CR=1 FL=1
MVTPFNEKGDVDYDRLTRHTDRLINNGVDYLVALGTTAETPTLSKQEKHDIVKCIVGTADGRIPVVVGAGGNNTAEVVETVRSMNIDGINGILSVAPYYNKPAQEGLYQHFSAISAVSEWPVILYNVPGRTGCNISADTVCRLASDFGDKIVGIKEASCDFIQIMQILKNKPENFLVISGDDAMALPMIALGGSGVISVIANAYPALFSTMIASALNGSYEKAREIHYLLLPMINAIFKEGNPAGVKTAMEIQGYIHNVLRLPLICASDPLHRHIKELHKIIQEKQR